MGCPANPAIVYDQVQNGQQTSVHWNPAYSFIGWPLTQYFDISFESSFAPGTFLGFQIPLSTFVFTGNIDRSRNNYCRVNTLFQCPDGTTQWFPSNIFTIPVVNTGTASCNLLIDGGGATSPNSQQLRDRLWYWGTQYNIPPAALLALAIAESTCNQLAQNGQYIGLYQIGTGHSTYSAIVAECGYDARTHGEMQIKKHGATFATYFNQAFNSISTATPRTDNIATLFRQRYGRYPSRFEWALASSTKTLQGFSDYEMITTAGKAAEALTIFPFGFVEGGGGTGELLCAVNPAWFLLPSEPDWRPDLGNVYGVGFSWNPASCPTGGHPVYLYIDVGTDPNFSAGSFQGTQLPVSATSYFGTFTPSQTLYFRINTWWDCGDGTGGWFPSVAMGFVIPAAPSVPAAICPPADLLQLGAGQDRLSNGRYTKKVTFIVKSVTSAYLGFHAAINYVENGQQYVMFKDLTINGPFTQDQLFQVVIDNIPPGASVEWSIGTPSTQPGACQVQGPTFTVPGATGGGVFTAPEITSIYPYISNNDSYFDVHASPPVGGSITAWYLDLVIAQSIFDAATAFNIGTPNVDYLSINVLTQPITGLLARDTAGQKPTYPFFIYARMNAQFAEDPGIWYPSQIDFFQPAIINTTPGPGIPKLPGESMNGLFTFLYNGPPMQIKVGMESINAATSSVNKKIEELVDVVDGQQVSKLIAVPVDLFLGNGTFDALPSIVDPTTGDVLYSSVTTDVWSVSGNV